MRLFASALVSLPEEVVRELGANTKEVGLVIGPLASAVPIVDADDATPLTEEEIRDYTGPLRKVAEDAMASDRDNLVATRVLNQMVNRLPASQSAGIEQYASLRQQTMKGVAESRPKADYLVRRAFATCQEKLRVERTPHLRACLSSEHDILSTNITQDVWKSLKPTW